MSRGVKKYDTELAYQLGVIEGKTHSEIAKQCGVSIRTIEKQSSAEGWGELRKFNDDFSKKHMMAIYKDRTRDENKKIVTKFQGMIKNYTEALDGLILELKDACLDDKLKIVKALGGTTGLDKIIRVTELMLGNADKRTETNHIVGLTAEAIATMTAQQLEAEIGKYKQTYIDADFTVIDDEDEEEYEENDNEDE